MKAIELYIKLSIDNQKFLGGSVISLDISSVSRYFYHPDIKYSISIINFF